MENVIGPTAVVDSALQTPQDPPLQAISGTDLLGVNGCQEALFLAVRARFSS